MDYLEYVTACYMLTKAGVQDKIKFLFDVYGYEQTGEITLDDFFFMMSETTENVENPVTAGMVTSMFHELDEDGSGSLSVEEIFNAVWNGQTALLTLGWSFLPVNGRLATEMDDELADFAPERDERLMTLKMIRERRQTQAFELESAVMLDEMVRRVNQEFAKEMSVRKRGVSSTHISRIK
eukprot:GFYU01005334.1.p1 GENE.GFYU01005334.1~~GFYU01005334.1.p1  ORF type:complete len:181 (-),score=78.73 GFYU01005334.1:104-646(-)